MTEHAFDPIPDEQHDDTPAVATESPPPNARVTVKQLRAAIEAGHWTHDVPGTALWLNTSFPPAGRESSELLVELTAHGIMCR